ncbi:hypothetical protein [Rahnella victoriana]|uniref:Uncharacterized protein n=1 Tax=Rahnella victoriana TaxID=1510570 RepID=A0ABS0DQJ5_9GAMM|nr:hypothetical protein [Rahnella victoriana]MBF7954413.1 hypothetical protein [Rahnella victoriana]
MCDLTLTLLQKLFDYLGLSGALDGKFIWYVIVSIVIVLVFIQIQIVFKSVRIIKDRRLADLEGCLLRTSLSPIDINNIKESIRNIIRYRLTGIKDVERQYIINELLDKNRNLIHPGFFKKFRTFLILKEGYLIFHKKVSYKFEIFFYKLFALQYLVLAATMVYLSVYRGAEIPIYAHVTIWAIVCICIFMFQAFSSMAPTKKECELLERVLRTQSDSVDVVVSLKFKNIFKRRVVTN